MHPHFVYAAGIKYGNWGVSNIASLHFELHFQFKQKPMSVRAERAPNPIIEQKKQGRVATAVIVEDSNSPEFAKRHLSEIYDSAGEIFRFFPSKEEAKWWLVQRITLAQNESPKSGY